MLCPSGRKSAAFVLSTTEKLTSVAVGPGFALPEPRLGHLMMWVGSEGCYELYLCSCPDIEI
jgi:hypothetical protein